MRNKGFTLFELLVVISIIGILLALGAVSFSAAQKRARDARRREDMDSVQKALEQYYALSGGDYPGSCYSSGETISYSGTVLMQSFPTDPKSPAQDYSNDGSCSANHYCYCALLEAVAGNSGNNCNWSAGDKDYYCVGALQ